MKNCVNCLVPEKLGGAFDGLGICGLCREHAVKDTTREEIERRSFETDLEETLKNCRGPGAYDCLVGLSGGKDSCYLLYKVAVEYKLRVLAFTVNINIPDVAWENIRRTVKKLDVPHLVFTPPWAFYRKMFGYLLRNQGEGGAVRTVCYLCAPLTESYSLKAAMNERIPLVLAGYSPGQPERARMLYEFPGEMISSADWTPRELKESGVFPEAELAGYWNPLKYTAGTAFPRFLAPFHAWRYSQGDVMKAVVDLGLIQNSRHASPVHSNCPVNWLLMYSDLKNLGYNSYAGEFARLIREGKASRRYWRVMQPLVNWMIRNKMFLGRNVSRSLEWLDLDESELKITRPAVSCRPAVVAEGRGECESCRGNLGELREEACLESA